MTTRESIITSLKKASNLDEIELEFPENEDFGDYSSNVAMILAKEKGKNPKDVAQEIVDKLKKDQDLAKTVSKIDIAGPGFINFFLSGELLQEELLRINREAQGYGESRLGEGKTVVIDYSSPNIAKRFGIGHLRSTVIGRALYNLFKSQGYEVIGDNHIGDWGTQFGTLLYQIDSKGLNPDELTIDSLEELYVEFNSEAKNDEKLWDAARDWFKKLEEKDPKALNIWQKVVEISKTEFQRIYELLGVSFEYSHGESFYQDKMPGVIEELRQKGLLIKSEGAMVVELKNMPPGLILKSDGATTYLTRDLATVKFRIGEWKPDIFVYEVGSDQTLHFRQLFEIVKLLGWTNDKQFVHVAHGLIRFPHGKMSTRKGETVKLEEVLDEAIGRAADIIGKSETTRGLSDKESREVAKQVGIGSVVYFDLSHHPETDIIFDWEKIFVLEGNSASYLQYCLARAGSVLAKAKGKKETGKFKPNAEEETVLRSLVRFPEIIAISTKNYSPNLLANYLFELAKKYNNFYNQHRIIGEENEGFRIALTSGVRQVLQNGLGLLGIATPDKM